jgi:nucleoside-diphosphate-sugar epimerase
MKVLVTGANGYLGQGVVSALLKKGCDVIATDFSLNNVSNQAEKITANLFEISDPYDFFDKPDVVLHMAWRDGFKHNSLNHMNDLAGHYNFLRLMSESGVKRIAVMGSMHEVGFYEGCIHADTPCHPASLYGIAKNALRDCTALLAKENHIDYQWLRAYYIVGNSKYGSSIFSKITDAAEKGQETFPFTTGVNQYDFIDYDVLCDQLSQAVMQDNVTGIIECCSGKPESLASRVERFISDNNYKIKLAYGTFPDRPYDSKAVWGDNSKITEIMKEK